MIDRDFFHQTFSTFVGEYAQHRGLQRNTNDLEVSVTLADGSELFFTGWRAGAGWIVLFTEDDQMKTVPYETITRVSVQPRPEPPSPPPRRPPVGFATVDSGPDSSD